MTVSSDCSYRVKDTDDWAKGSSGDGQLGGKSHAEQTAYQATLYKSDGAKKFKFIQNAFPCYKCLDFFLLKSVAGASFVFECTENHGLYAVEACYVPDNHPKARDATLAGTLRIEAGEVRGLYSTMVVYPAAATPTALAVINSSAPAKCTKTKNKK